MALLSEMAAVVSARKKTVNRFRPSLENVTYATTLLI